jgi:UrcA family protein
MSSHRSVTSSRWYLGAAAVASLFLAGVAAAQDRTIPLSVHVDSRGLNLDRPADVERLYKRVKHAAWDVCSNVTRVGLQNVPNKPRCIDDAAAEAIRGAHIPALTRIYIASHSLAEAAARGIDVSAQMALLQPEPVERPKSP